MGGVKSDDIVFSNAASSPEVFSSLRKRYISVDIIRIFACALIVWNHISGFMLHGWGNPLYWANIGVYVFFFMSGYLYSRRKIEEPNIWIKNNVMKLMKPYWIYLAIVGPLLFVFYPSTINLGKFAVALLGVQGIFRSYAIYGLGQHWFISYMIICYCLTPITIEKVNCLSGKPFKKYWCTLLGMMIAGQILTIPIAYLVKFITAYIFTFISGVFYGSRYRDTGNFIEEKRFVDSAIYCIALVGLVFRVMIQGRWSAVLPEAVSDVLIHWIKLFQGASIFIALFNVIDKVRAEKSSKIISFLAGLTYEVYIVHEIYTHDIITNLIGPESIVIKLTIVLLCIIISGAVLKLLEQGLDCMINHKYKIEYKKC